MNTITDALTEASEKVTSTLEEGILTFNRNVAGLVAKAPAPPSWMPKPEGIVPSDELVTRAFTLQAERVEAGRKFALALVDTWKPVTSKLTGAES